MAAVALPATEAIQSMSLHALPIRERLLLTMQMTCVKVALAKEERTKSFAPFGIPTHQPQHKQKPEADSKI